MHLYSVVITMDKNFDTGKKFFRKFVYLKPAYNGSLRALVARNHSFLLRARDLEQDEDWLCVGGEQQ